MAMPVASDRVMMLELLDKVAFTATGSTWVYYELGNVVKDVGPLLDAIQAYALAQNITVAGFEYRVVAQASYDTVTWQDFTADLITPQGADGNAFGTPNTTQADFGPHLRFRLAVRNTSAGTLGGTISLKIALRFLTEANARAAREYDRLIGTLPPRPARPYPDPRGDWNLDDQTVFPLQGVELMARTGPRWIDANFRLPRNFPRGRATLSLGVGHARYLPGFKGGSGASTFFGAPVGEGVEFVADVRLAVRPSIPASEGQYWYRLGEIEL